MLRCVIGTEQGIESFGRLGQRHSQGRATYTVNRTKWMHRLVPTKGRIEYKDVPSYDVFNTSTPRLRRHCTEENTALAPRNSKPRLMRSIVFAARLAR